MCLVRRHLLVVHEFLNFFKVPVQNVLHVIPSRKCFTAGGLWAFACTSGYCFTEMSQPQISSFLLGSEQPLPALVFPQWTKALVCSKEGKGGKLQGLACIYLFLKFLLALSLFLSLALLWIFLLSPGWFGVVSRGPLYDKKNKQKTLPASPPPTLGATKTGGFVSMPRSPSLALCSLWAWWKTRLETKMAFWRHLLSFQMQWSVNWAENRWYPSVVTSGLVFLKRSFLKKIFKLTKHSK